MPEYEKKDIAGPFTMLPYDDVLIGAGTVQNLSDILGRYGVKRALLITGNTLFQKTDLVDKVRAAAGGRVAGVFHETAQHVPRQFVIRCTEKAREVDADAIISFGGGSPNDTAKAVVMALAENIREPSGFDRVMIKFEYPDKLEIPAIAGEPVPLFAIPTTLSAGEFTHFIGVTDEERKVKDLYIDKKLMAKAIVLDPELTLATPQWLWLSSGMRAVDHCVEALCSTTAHPFTDATCSHGLKLLRRYLRECKDDPNDLTARVQAQVASWLSIAGLANVTLGLSHGIGHQLGARCGVPHGHTSCVMLHNTLTFNREHTKNRQGVVAGLMGIETSTLSEDEAAAAASAAVLQLVKELDQPYRLRDVGVEREDFKGIAEDALADMIVAANPRPISSVDEVIELLEMAY